jgi:rSAM/selenodomain-associated transferase 2
VPKASIIIPVLNEAEHLVSRLKALQSFREQDIELILVDGGSSDHTQLLAEGWVDQLICSAAGRALQMNSGAHQATGTWLFFLHIDTRLSAEAEKSLLSIVSNEAPNWGRFDVLIEGKHPLLGLVANMMNLRSRLSGIATGDQLIFVHRSLFDAVGAFPKQPLMEDVELSKRLKKIQPPLCFSERVITSGRRWDQNGFWSTVILMWSLRWRYWRGETADELVKEYYS